MNASHRPEAMQPVVHRVTGGLFREGPEYTTWRTHGTDDYLLIHTLSGAGRIGDTDGEIQAAFGDAILLPPGVRHDYGTAPGAAGWELGFAHFHPRAEWIPLLKWPTRNGTIGQLHAAGEVHRRVAAALRRAARVRHNALARAELFAVNALEEALLWLDTQNPLTTRTDERILEVMEYVASHVSDHLNVEDLAALVHLSPSRLTHLFTEQLGTSPQRYVERERMLLAEQLLNLTNRTVASIAHETGWEDPRYFSRRFHRFAGHNPSDYRRLGRDG